VQRAKELRVAMTPQETALWERLRNNKMDGLHFRRQQIIDGFVVDFDCHKTGIVTELDGPIHLRQADYDRERDKVIAAHDLTIVRATNHEIDTNLAQVLRRIRATCRARTSRLTRLSSPRHPLPLREGGRGVRF
jgi:very-short-patch-repair endonuclease